MQSAILKSIFGALYTFKDHQQWVTEKLFKPTRPGAGDLGIFILPQEQLDARGGSH